MDTKRAGLVAGLLVLTLGVWILSAPSVMSSSEAAGTTGGVIYCEANSVAYGCKANNCGNYHYCVGTGNNNCDCDIYCNSGGSGCGFNTQEILTDCRSS